MSARVRRCCCLAILLPAATLGAQERATPDTGFRAHLAHLPAGSGIWHTSNARYRTNDNGEPASYGQRYWLGFGGTTVHGCLWGEYPGQRPVFWRFFTAWDPTRQEFLVHQESPNGTIGLGYENAKTGIADQTFSRPDGSSFRSRHDSKHAGPDTLITQSFDWANDSWTPRRAYTWVRQPAGTPAGC
jgi:hypothetical protein